MNSDRSTRGGRDGLFKGVFLAYAILILHVVLLAAMGLLVFFFSGMIRYIFWIFLFGAILIVFSGYMFYRRLKREGRSLRESLQTPQFQGRTVEIGVLGGLITLKLGKPSTTAAIGDYTEAPVGRLEDPETVRIREIATLGRLLEEDLITPEEFKRAKMRLLGQILPADSSESDE